MPSPFIFVSLAGGLSVILIFSKNQVIISFSPMFCHFQFHWFLLLFYYFLPFTCLGLFVLFIGSWGKQTIDWKPFLFSNVCSEGYIFSSQHCFSCISLILICCILIFIHSVYILTSLETFLWSTIVYGVCNFSCLTLFLISRLIPMSLENTFYMILTFKNFVRFILWLKMWSILLYVLKAHENSVYMLLLGGIFCKYWLNPIGQ